MKLYVGDCAGIILADPGSLFDHCKEAGVLPIPHDQGGQPRGGCQLVVVRTLLKLEALGGMRLDKGLVVFQRASGGFVNVASVDTRPEIFYKAAPEGLWIEATFFCE